MILAIFIIIDLHIIAVFHKYECMLEVLGPFFRGLLNDSGLQYISVFGLQGFSSLLSHQHLLH